MITVSSISGGKSSAYMAIHFPTDIYLFAVVLTDHKGSQPRDPGLLRECQKRIPHFIASHEADQTLLNVLKLEQEIGKEIIWVASDYSLDKFILGQTQVPGYCNGSRLPNQLTRFCTVQQKIMPIFQRCYMHYSTPIIMNIGFRWDENRRVENWTCDKDKFKYYYLYDLVKKRYRWKTVEWRISQFPLYEHRIDRQIITEYWNRKGWVFPEISNCRFCFFHSDFQLQVQAQREPSNLEWWLDMESKLGYSFGKRPLKERLEQPLLFNMNDEEKCLCTD